MKKKEDGNPRKEGGRAEEEPFRLVKAVQLPPSGGSGGGGATLQGNTLLLAVRPRYTSQPQLVRSISSNRWY